MRDTVFRKLYRFTPIRRRFVVRDEGTADTPPSGRIMSSIAGSGGLAHKGGLAGKGGGLAG